MSLPNLVNLKIGLKLGEYWPHPAQNGPGVRSQFSPFRYFPNFQNNQTTGYLNNITLIFDRCHTWQIITWFKVFNLCFCRRHMTTQIWVNTGSGNGVLPYGTKPLSEPMLTNHQLGPVTDWLRAISQEKPRPSVIKIRLKNTKLTFSWNLSGDNELTNGALVTSTPDLTCLEEDTFKLFSDHFEAVKWICSMDIPCLYYFWYHQTLNFVSIVYDVYLHKIRWRYTLFKIPRDILKLLFSHNVPQSIPRTYSKYEYTRQYIKMESWC